MQREQLGEAHAEGLTTGHPGSADAALAARLDSGEVLAFGADGLRTGLDLRRDVAAVAQALPQADPGSQVLIVIRGDRYALVVALLAVWQRGYVAALPPEHDREAITSLAAESVTVLHDTASGAALRIAPLLAAREAADAAGGEALTWSGVSRGRLYRRAADGSLQRACSDEAWLERAHALADALRLRAGQRCATTVGMGHPHGVLLGALAPLLAEAAFLREPLTAAALGEPSPPLDVLIGVPAQLGALLESGAAQPARVGRVVSALDALAPDLAARLTQQLGAPVEDRADLARAIPLLGAGEPAELHSAEDQALLSLVRSAPGVRDAAVLSLSGAERPSRCVAVVGPAPDEPTATPLQLPALRALVAQQDPGAELLVVREIRRDGLGRYQRAALLRLFRRRADGTPVHSVLSWSETQRSVQGDLQQYRASVRIPADCPYFDGHFPGYPILPGAAQLSELVLPLVRRARPELGRLCAMSRLKFSGRIQPGESIDVVVQGRPGDSQLDFTLRRAHTLCAAGSLSFASAGERTP